MQEACPLYEVGTETQLLMDDYLVEDIWLIRRAPEPPVKYLNNPIPGIGRSVLYDPEDRLFKAWYPDRMVISVDGLNWNPKDAIPLTPPNGSGPVMKDPYDPNPDRRYKMMTKRNHSEYFFSHGGRAFAAFSPDGVHWNWFS